jgi:hypothetical protein
MKLRTKIRFIDDPLMPSDEAFRIIPSVDNQEFVLTIKRSLPAKFDTDANSELYRFLLLAGKEKFLNTYSLYELYFNASAGDFRSLQTVANLRKLAVQDTFQPIFPGAQTSKEQQSYWENIVSQFESQEKKYNKQVKVHNSERKVVMDALDKVSDDQQFRNLVAKNDRKGAAELLRSYLPWEEMPPFEKKFWETHLKVMVDPLPIEQRVLIYRGIDDDVIQKSQLAGKVLTEEEAIKEQQIFLMSTMMTKNQGTWNRRLRSLTSMYEKFIATDNSGKSDFVSTARISTMLYKHSREPKGSPFLSFSPDLIIAQKFGLSKLTAYFLDPRLIYFNNASGYMSEIEFLLPIASFPEDLAAVFSRNIHGDINSAVFVKSAAVEKLEKTLGPGKGQAAYEKIVKKSDEYFKPVMQKNGIVAKMPLASDTDGLLKKVIGKSSKETAQALNGNEKLYCMDLIQLFWK